MRIVGRAINRAYDDTFFFREIMMRLDSSDIVSDGAVAAAGSDAS